MPPEQISEDEEIIEEQPTEEVEEETEGTEEEPTEETDEITVTIGDEEDEEEAKYKVAPDWVKNLRKTNREDKRRIRELEERLNKQTEIAKPVLGKKPTLEECDYDADKFDTELANWYEQKRLVDEEAARIAAEQERQNQAWNEKINAYNSGKAALKVSNFEDAEETVKEVLSITQQGIIISGATKPEIVIYALGKNPTKLQEVAAITDPVQFAFAIANLQRDLKMQPKKTPETVPEKRVVGSAPNNAAEKTLDQLRTEAEKTGDYSKVTAYKRNLREAGK